MTTTKPPKLQEMEQAQGYANQWYVEMKASCCSDPVCCIIAIICPCCTSFQLRRKALHFDLSKYECCGGLLPCSGKCAEAKCPELCLCCETFWCFATSVMVTRFMIQQQYQIQNSPCDNCLMATTVCMIQLACMCQCLACITGNDAIDQCADIFSCLADLLYCTVCSCMQAQHNVEMDYQGSGPAAIQMAPMSAPQQQTMSAQV